MKEDNKVQSSNSKEKTIVQTDKNQVNGQDK